MQSNKLNIASHFYSKEFIIKNIQFIDISDLDKTIDRHEL